MDSYHKRIEEFQYRKEIQVENTVIYCLIRTIFSITVVSE